MKTLIPLCLLAVTALAGTAAAQTAPAGDDCVVLSSDHQIVRKNAAQSVLLRNGSDHYVVSFTNSCGSAATSRKLDFDTPSQESQVCAGVSKLVTDSQFCSVAKIKSISAGEFASRAR
ncbi:hypothetical protein J7J08_07250 [Stenotrophomonas sp. ISL-67]|uniref:hypothetical protein n=1 Tax=Stenotrophomonas sp. ISL-67 TaxID=2819171 RepID=UPI001BE919D5|nr:hypothetical protein [Stenotrophomonas sp. ISL-67]MBT2767432.1 hypothetical protein [Stenotrophomonas sp. ISL-67]